ERTGYVLDYRPYTQSGTIETQNVLAYLEGADPELKEEVLVLMAHYDHVGIGQPDSTGDMIYNGADDNGSGTVALMAIANALNNARSQGFKPKRSILFLHVSAEEVGLLGSRYYSDHPVIPIENTVANFNADMIGRSDPKNIEAGDTDYVYLIGGEIISSGLDSLVTTANEHTVNMRLDRRYNDLTDSNQFYRRSDHWNFGRLSVPFVFFFTGVHEDYHQPSDTFDKIEFDKYNRVVQLIYSASIMVTNYDGRPVVDNQEFIDITGRMAR
ncbi:MAG: M20/M25/M40 family metallo-hydrolase, partial [Balneolaceae bacterium]|nr:M20/M25/M40 family metallo-hydrolase [Balneolaceae bacterium]